MLRELTSAVLVIALLGSAERLSYGQVLADSETLDLAPPSQPLPSPITNLPEPLPLNVPAGQSDDTSIEPQAAESGPVHEAFAEPFEVSSRSEIVLSQKPPEAIEELPPEPRPDGANVEWINGYWSWDDQREQFMWVSGVWRRIPKGRSWEPGQWIVDDNGDYRWVPGAWVDIQLAANPVLLPEPPASLDEGPNSPAPSNDHFWIPGCWNYQAQHYVWRPGFWTPQQTNWVWIPDYYVWRPGGYAYVPGYWDYTWARRGTLYAPYYFNRYPVNVGYRFTPSVVIGTNDLFAQLWIRPGYSSFYFGNYYGYTGLGYSPWYRYVVTNSIYDPLYNHYRWVYGRNSVGFGVYLDGRHHDRYGRQPNYVNWNRQINDSFYRGGSRVNYSYAHRDRDRDRSRDSNRGNDRNRVGSNSGGNRDPNRDRLRAEALGSNNNRGGNLGRSDNNRPTRVLNSRDPIGNRAGTLGEGRQGQVGNVRDGDRMRRDPIDNRNGTVEGITRSDLGGGRSGDRTRREPIDTRSGTVDGIRRSQIDRRVAGDATRATVRPTRPADGRLTPGNVRSEVSRRQLLRVPTNTPTSNDQRFRGSESLRGSSNPLNGIRSRNPSTDRDARPAPSIRNFPSNGAGANREFTRGAGNRSATPPAAIRSVPTPAANAPSIRNIPTPRTAPPSERSRPATMRNSSPPPSSSSRGSSPSMSSSQMKRSRDASQVRQSRDAMRQTIQNRKKN